MTTPAGVLAFKEAIERRDHEALRAALAPNVRFHSPVRFRPFEGRDDIAAVRPVPKAIFVFTDSFRYTQVFTDGNREIRPTPQAWAAAHDRELPPSRP